jgi:hypothetical protein
VDGDEGGLLTFGLTGAVWTRGVRTGENEGDGGGVEERRREGEEGEEGETDHVRAPYEIVNHFWNYLSEENMWKSPQLFPTSIKIRYYSKRNS